MRSISLPSLTGSSAFLGLLGVLTLSCSPGGPTDPEDPPPPTRGSLRISVQTTGDDADADGYVVSVTGRSNQSVTSNGSTLFEDLSPGVYTVSLSGVAANCTVTGGSAREVTVIAGPTTASSFVVSCEALVGAILVTTVTTGADIDPDGYQVTIDGTITQSIGSSGSISFTSLAAGTRSVLLDGLADNCVVSGSNPRNVTVAAGGSAQATFNVECSSLLGGIIATTATTGEDLDPDGYAVVLDGSTTRSIAVNGTVTLEGLAVGTHTVELTEVASNCSVSGANPQTVTVAEGGSTTAAFAITCGALTGSVEVVVETSGTNVDPDGYTVVLDGGSSKSAGVNDTLTFANVTPGDHSVELNGIAGNCSVSGSNPKTTTVVAGGTGRASFAITCTSPVGTLQVGATTTGANLDVDGYVASIDGGARTTRIEVNGSTGFGNLDAGNHEVALLDVAENCQVFGDNPRTVAVIGGQTVTMTFSLECSATVGQIRVRTNTVGVDLDPNGYVAEIDGGFRTTRLGVVDETGFGNLIPGDHQVGLTDVAANCTVLGQNPRTVALAAGQTVLTTFGVECEQLAPCIEPPSGVVSWWSGDGTALDVLGANDGTASGDVTYETGFVANGNGQAFSFPGILRDGVVLVPSSAELNPTASSGFTVEGWVMSNLTDYNGAVVSKGALSAEQFVLDQHWGKWRAFMRKGDGNITLISAPMQAQTFTHLAMTWDGSQLSLYVNGGLAATALANSMIVTDQDLRIGLRDEGGSDDLQLEFDGLVDELTFYGRALSLTEISGIYDAGDAGKCRP